MNATIFIFGSIIFITLFGGVLYSILENERRAALRLFFLSIILPLPYLYTASSYFPGHRIISICLIIITGFGILALFLPIRGKKIKNIPTPNSQIDERDTMFSRNTLQKGSKEFRYYYDKNPHLIETDENIRKNPGLLSSGTKYFHPFGFASANANFETIEKLRDYVDGNVNKKQQQISPIENTKYVKKWIKQLGAVNVGIAELKDYHFYSNAGRGNDYGKTISNNHKYGIVLVVEMDKKMVDCAPAAPAVMESARQYMRVGSFAVQLAEFIRKIGFPAKAHIDGKYELVCPLVARDAGLGEIGRMGILITPKYGSRVRLAVVTTDLPVIPDKWKFDKSVDHFCKICKKCAECCPRLAIPFDDKQNINGVERWQINSEKCFNYWTIAGTDCARCMSVCPYSHHNNLFHNFIRMAIRNSIIFQKFAILMDDFIYGKKPKANSILRWMQTKNA